MSSRSATVLVIFVVACIAFCLASVFASMTGPISILPNESDSAGVLDNLSVITDSDNNDYQSYGYDESNDYSQSSDDSQYSEPQVETTTDDSSDYQSSPQESSDQSSQSDGSDSADVVTTTDDGQDESNQ